MTDASSFCTHGRGCWPSFFLLGVQKSASTSLASFLVDHRVASFGKEQPDSNGHCSFSHARPRCLTGRDRALKEPHAFDTFFVRHPNASSDNYTRLFRAPARGVVPHFLDATPNYFTPGPARILLHRLPPQLVPRIKLVAVLREPISRALSLHNHIRALLLKGSEFVYQWAAYRNCYRDGAGASHGTNRTFDAVMRCHLARVGGGWGHRNWKRAADNVVAQGVYVDGLNAWRPFRSNLLIVAYVDLLHDESSPNVGSSSSSSSNHHYNALATIIQHLGIAWPGNAPKPTLRHTHLSIQSSPKKTEVVRCSTVAVLRKYYEPLNELLYRALDEDRTRGRAPSIEHPFPKFEVRVPCAMREMDRHETDLLRRSFGGAIPAADRGSIDKYGDARLERLGVFAQMGPAGQPIIYGVLCSAIEKQRAAMIKQTWCAEKACVYFSNAARPATGKGHPPPASGAWENVPAAVATIDIETELIVKHGYPLWTQRDPPIGRPIWPAYRAAQLRFLPALHWLRERTRASAVTNPKAQRYFGQAQWVVLVDDDTLVLPHHLASHLSTLDFHERIYTGLVFSPKRWVGLQFYEGVSPHQPFVAGGGSTVLSRAALNALDTAACIAEMRPDGAWWQWQSDWAIGACALREGITPREAPKGKFSQFICLEPLESGPRPFFCRTKRHRDARNASGGLPQWDSGDERRMKAQNSADGALEAHPATLHPIKKPDDMLSLWKRYTRAAR